MQKTYTTILKLFLHKWGKQTARLFATRNWNGKLA